MTISFGSKMGRFKELRVWQDSMDLCEQIYSITSTGLFEKDFGLKNQIQRAVVSISSNIAEGDERATNKESIHYFNMAKGSTAEVITQLNIAYRVGYIDKVSFSELEDLTEKTRASLKNLIAARKSKQQG